MAMRMNKLGQEGTQKMAAAVRGREARPMSPAAAAASDSRFVRLRLESHSGAHSILHAACAMKIAAKTKKKTARFQSTILDDENRMKSR